MSYDYIELFDDYPDTTIVFGKASFTQLATLLQMEQYRTVLVFTGRSSADKSGAWQKLLDSTQTMDFDICRYSDINSEPTIETVKNMVEELDRIQPDAVCALGGGSIMDAAKAAYLVYQTGTDIKELFGVNQFSSKNVGTVLKKVICIPTTSGTGSEATPYSNIVDNDTAVKKLIVEKEIIPAYSFLIPTFTLSLDQGNSIATALDGMAHSIEGFLNIHQDENNPNANKWAKKSVELIKKHLPNVINNPESLSDRAALSSAACLGGMVIRYKSTGLPHLCSFSWFGKIKHGTAVAVLLPYAWKYYIESEEVAGRTMELKETFAPEASSPEEVIKGYVEFIESLGVKTALKDYPTLSEMLMESTAESASENRMKLELSPRPVALNKSKEVLSEILQNAWNGNI